MTNKEAIAKLKGQKNEYLNEYVDFAGIAEAYDMAINALTAIDTMQKIVDGDVDTIMQILKENEE